MEDIVRRSILLVSAIDRDGVASSWRHGADAVALDLAGVMCSTGSACSSGSLLPSPVLKAMGILGERLHSAMRFSFGPGLSEADLDEAARRIVRVVKRLRETQDE